MISTILRTSVVAAALPTLVFALTIARPATAAPKSFTCLQTVTISFDDSRYAPKGDLPKADGPCELALSATPTGAYGIQFVSLTGSPKDFKKIKKLKPAQRIQLLADQLAAGGKASPVQDVEPVGLFSMGFSVFQGPSGATTASHIASTLVGSALLFVVLDHQADRDPKAPAFDRSAARTELLNLLAGVQLGSAKSKK